MENRMIRNKQARQKVKSLKKYYKSSYFAQIIGIKPKSFNNWMCGNRQYLSEQGLDKLIRMIEEIK